MSVNFSKQLLEELQQQIIGEVRADKLDRVIYATDASVYRVLPVGVVFPMNTQDVVNIVKWAGKYQVPLIPRTAGTSLAGQCVGEGLVIDLSRHMCKIFEVDVAQKTVVVQPGVIRDELNQYLAPFGLFFGPNTSTANRAMIGGMVGNNSCGSTSIVYGTTRDHVIELETVLHDGQLRRFAGISHENAIQKSEQEDLEGRIYKHILDALSDELTAAEILRNYPKSSIHRRNNGYAVDTILEMQPFNPDGPALNLCSLLCGSEGTLAIATEITLTLDNLPNPEIALVCGHFLNVQESLLATQVAMRHNPEACELMDKVILDCTLQNLEQRKNRFFVTGDPGAILIVEFRSTSQVQAHAKADQYISELKALSLGFAYPVLDKSQSGKAWELRMAGLGLLSNIPGKRKAVACIEDTAVDIADLPEYIAEFDQIMEKHGQNAVYYAHAGAGELHLRPVLDLKNPNDIKDFRSISTASARLVKKYQGSLAGEHGVGRVRAEFLPEFIGEKNYNLLVSLKEIWDPNYLFNPGKIVKAPPMDHALRYEVNQQDPEIKTMFRYPGGQGILGMAENCNGSGDCRKLPTAGGTMCPSYQATRDEKDTTRARANVLREYLTRHREIKNIFNHHEIKEVLDLCLSCKGCTSECPSNVDMSMLKAEFQYQYYLSNRRHLSHWFVIHNHWLGKFGSIVPGVTNKILSQPLLRKVLQNVMGFHTSRPLPAISSKSLRARYQQFIKQNPANHASLRKIYLFCDEFTQWYDSEIGEKAIRLLSSLGYEVVLTRPLNSGRSYFSKGYLSKAKQAAEQNVSELAGLVNSENPLIGIEPSAILGFRDEYPKLVKESLIEPALDLSNNSYLIEEFIAKEFAENRITSASFDEKEYRILLHGHCHQKSLTDLSASITSLSIPLNTHVEIIPSGCCGMAGAFGYEKEHYEVSMQIGEMVLFPAIRKERQETLIVASGTSCRHQIQDGTNREAIHPVEFLYQALIK